MHLEKIGEVVGSLFGNLRNFWLSCEISRTRIVCSYGLQNCFLLVNRLWSTSSWASFALPSLDYPSARSGRWPDRRARLAWATSCQAQISRRPSIVTCPSSGGSRTITKRARSVTATATVNVIAWEMQFFFIFVVVVVVWHLLGIFSRHVLDHHSHFLVHVLSFFVLFCGCVVQATPDQKEDRTSTSSNSWGTGSTQSTQTDTTTQEEAVWRNGSGLQNAKDCDGGSWQVSRLFYRNILGYFCFWPLIL